MKKPHEDMCEFVAGEMITDTDLAWLLLIEDHRGEDHEVWLPKSLCEFDDDEGTVKMPEWLAVEKGLV